MFSHLLEGVMINLPEIYARANNVFEMVICVAYKYFSTF